MDCRLCGHACPGGGSYSEFGGNFFKGICESCLADAQAGWDERARRRGMSSLSSSYEEEALSHHKRRLKRR